MSGFVKEFSAASGASGSVLSVVASVPALIPSGNTLIAALALLDTGTPINSITASDTKGNTWTFLRSATLTGAASTTLQLLYCVVTTPLTSSDTITFTFPFSVGRSAISIAEFNDILTPDQYAVGDNGGASTTFPIVGPTQSTTEANELIYGAFSMFNPGRIFTATNGYTGLTKVVSTGGTGNRAIASEYKYVSSVGTYTASGTFDTAGAFVGTVQTFRLSVAQLRSGHPKVWNGTDWVAHPAKVWDGTTWVERPMKAYDGSDWIESL